MNVDEVLNEMKFISLNYGNRAPLNDLSEEKEALIIE
jgi:hypothetical protein